jgi:hypothetical protein
MHQGRLLTRKPADSTLIIVLRRAESGPDEEARRVMNDGHHTRPFLHVSSEALERHATAAVVKSLIGKILIGDTGGDLPGLASQSAV